MVTIGEIKEFRQDKEDWDQYTERLDHFFAANGITGADKKHSVFLIVASVVSPRRYYTAKNLQEPIMW